MLRQKKQQKRSLKQLELLNQLRIQKKQILKKKMINQLKLQSTQKEIHQMLREQKAKIRQQKLMHLKNHLLNRQMELLLIQLVKKHGIMDFMTGLMHHTLNLHIQQNQLKKLQLIRQQSHQQLKQRKMKQKHHLLPRPSLLKLQRKLKQRQKHQRMLKKKQKQQNQRSEELFSQI